MDVTNTLLIIRISPCDLHNGNYNRDSQKKSNTIYSNVKTISFQEMLENEKTKQQK